MTHAGSARTGVLPWLAAVCAVVAIGLAVRFAVGGPLGDVVGGMLYTVLLALLLYPLLALGSGGSGRRARVWLAAALGGVLSVAIELLQLTGLPAALATVFPPARLILGTSFAALDLVAYAIGALLFGAVGTLLVTHAGSCTTHAGSREQPRNEAATEAE